MHKSRLAGFIFDCQTTEPGAAAQFWRQALGYRDSAETPDHRYVELKDGPDTLHIEIQAVEHTSGVHIDIETDDIDAEVRRLEKLGATKVARIKRWWVMQAPSGQRFCVVRPQRPDFDERASVWPD